MALGIAGHPLYPPHPIAALALVVVLACIYYVWTGKEIAGRRFSAVALIFFANLAVFVLEGIPLDPRLPVIPGWYAPVVVYDGLVPSLFVTGQQWWAPLTQMFVHADLWHILGNMLFLWLIGGKVEQRLGRRRFLVMYLLAGFFATLLTLGGVYLLPASMQDLSLLRLPSPDVPNIGASGAVYGLIGFSIAAFPRERVLVPTPIIMTWWPAWAAAIFYVLYNLFIGLTGSNVAWWAHLGGMVLGAAYGLMWRLRPRHRIDSVGGWASSGPVRYSYTYRER